MTHWNVIPGLSPYFASPDGRIMRDGRVRVLHLNHKGYPIVQLSIDGTKSTHSVHRLVALTYLPKVEGKNVINHKNGIKTDNRVENLEWCNDSENSLHAIENKLFVQARGERCGGSKLTEDEVRSIRKESEAGVINAELSRRYKTSQSNIGMIVSGRAWKHVTN